MSKPAILIVAIAALAVILAPTFARAADDGATLYQAKCAACHGVDGAGKPAAKIPSLVSEDVKKATDDDLSDGIANGGAGKKPAHAFQAKGLSPNQIRMIVSYIRELQKR